MEHALRVSFGLLLMMVGWALGLALPAACFFFVYRMVVVGPATHGRAGIVEDRESRSAEVWWFLRWFAIIAVRSLVWAVAALAFLGPARAPR